MNLVFFSRLIFYGFLSFPCAGYQVFVLFRCSIWPRPRSPPHHHAFSSFRVVPYDPQFTRVCTAEKPGILYPYLIDLAFKRSFPSPAIARHVGGDYHPTDATWLDPTLLSHSSRCRLFFSFLSMYIAKAFDRSLAPSFRTSRKFWPVYVAWSWKRHSIVIEVVGCWFEGAAAEGEEETKKIREEWSRGEEFSYVIATLTYARRRSRTT